MTHPTDDEIMELAGAWFHTGENQKRDDGYYYRSLGTPSNVRGSDLIEFARALLAEQAKDAAEDARMTTAARDVLAERQRQVSAEGWTPEHDDGHDRGDLARAAGCYAIVAGDCQGWPNETYKGVSPPSCQTDDFEREHTFWPWKMSDWKPNHPRRDLVRAGALILAEIERLDRAARAKE